MSSKSYFENNYKYILAASLVLTTIAIIFFAYSHYKQEKDIVRNNILKELELHSTSKSRLIKNWLQERKGDTEFLQKIKFMHNEINSLVKNINNNGLKDSISNQFDVFRKMYSYSNVILLDKEGNYILSAIKNDSLNNPNNKKRIIESNFTEEFILLEFYKWDGKAYSDILFPVRDNNGNQNLAYISIRIDTENFLFPLLKDWQAQYKTAESVLYEVTDDTITSLNPINKNLNTTYALTYDLNDTSAPIVKRINSLPFKGIGIDYKNDVSFANIRRIGESNLILVLKIDEDEVMQEFNSHIAMTFASLIFIFLLILGLLYFIYRNIQKGIYRELYKQELALRHSNEIFRTTLYSIGDGVITTDKFGKIKQMNKIAEDLTGWR